MKRRRDVMKIYYYYTREQTTNSGRKVLFETRRISLFTLGLCFALYQLKANPFVLVLCFLIVFCIRHWQS